MKQEGRTTGRITCGGAYEQERRGGNKVAHDTLSRWNRALLIILLGLTDVKRRHDDNPRLKYIEFERDALLPHSVFFWPSGPIVSRES